MKRPNKLRKNIHKNRNWIFAIAEIGLAGGALYFAGKGTLKFQKYLEEDNDPAPAAYNYTINRFAIFKGVK